jgi:hypothetical protein
VGEFEAVALRNQNLMLSDRVRRLSKELIDTKQAVENLEEDASYMRANQILLDEKVEKLEARDPLGELEEALNHDLMTS